MIEPHRETGHEELYVVVRGVAAFTLGEETFDAATGTLVHAPPGTFEPQRPSRRGRSCLPSARRPVRPYAVGLGGLLCRVCAPAGRRLKPARAIVAEALAREPDAWQGAYNAACFEALAGESDAALGQLRRAVALNRQVLEYAAEDEDLASVRADPRYAEVVAMSCAHVDELDRIEMPDGFVWRPVRRRFDIRAFGVNAYTALAVGEPIVETHTEGQLGHEEIYFVLRGRVLFTIDEHEHELGAGELVFVRDPSLRRGAVAATEDAVVLALGGKPGAPHEVSAWEPMFAAVPAANREDWDEAIRIHVEALVERPEHPALLYNLACMEARGGHLLDALLHLKRAVELESKWAEHARNDSDFAAIRSEPGFP